MSKKSLRKLKKETQKETQKVSQNLHLLGGKVDVTHSHSPIAVTEIKDLDELNPQYAKDLIEIIKKSVDNDRLETELYYKAVDKEQENDKLSIVTKSKDKNRSIISAFLIITLLIVTGGVLIYTGYPWIGGAVLTTVLGTIGKAVFFDSSKEKEEKEES